MASLAQLFANGVELSLSTVLLVVVASLLLLALQAASAQRKREREARDNGKRALRRKMSNIGISTLVTETETNLSIPVSLLSVEGTISVEEFTARLQERMVKDDFFRRFRSLVVNDEKEFVELADFDVSRHVTTHKLREGETPISYLESITNQPLDFNKPLWEMHVMVSDAPTEDVTYCAWKVHHCIGDGQSLAVALIRLSDNKVQFDEMIAKHQQAKKSAPKPPTSVATKVTSLAQFGALCVWSMYVVQRKLVTMLLRAEPATLFKRTGGTRKKLSHHMTYSVAETKRVGKHFHATVNDVMLSCVAGAMRRALVAKGEEVAPSLTVRAAIPVDMRGTDEVVTDARNKFSALVIDFPIGVADPAQRLARIRRNMNEAKHSLEKFFTYWSSHVLAYLPAWVMKPLLQLTTSRISVAVSNVRGAAFSLALCGKKLKGYYGFVPPPPTVNLGIAVLSVGDELGLNVLVDPSVGITGTDFLAFAKQEFDALAAIVDAPSSGDKKQQ
jgi:diacylglycerol O-acyltransferase / wax synthase